MKMEGNYHKTGQKFKKVIKSGKLTIKLKAKNPKIFTKRVPQNNSENLNTTLFKIKL